MRDLYTTRAVSQRDVEQATSDQQTAEGNLRAARDAVRLFGKTDAEIDRIIADRSADSTLVVPSPIDGRITARNAAPGLFVQPGNAPAPYTVADIDTMWMMANVAEDRQPGVSCRAAGAGQSSMRFPAGCSTARSPPSAPRSMPIRAACWCGPRSRIRNTNCVPACSPNFVIRVGGPTRSPGVALDGVVREGDGTMTAWVTADRRHFTRRLVKIGEQRDGYWQILDGVQAGELVATEGALFLSNELAIASH